MWDVFLHKSVNGGLEGCPHSLTVQFCCLLIDVSGKLSKFLLESLIVGSMVFIHSARLLSYCSIILKPDDILMKLHMPNHTMVIYTQYKFH